MTRIADCDLERVPVASSIAEADRPSLLASFDAVTNAVWNKPADVFQRSAARIFRPDVGLVVLRHGDDVIGFSIHQRVTVDGADVLYHSHAHVLPGHQGKGLFTAILDHVTAMGRPGRPGTPLHYCWRTRSPVVWVGCARRCASIVPDLHRGTTDDVLMDLGRRTAQVLFPQVTLELPSMIMRDAYNPAGGVPSSIKTQAHHGDQTFDARFFAHLGPSPYDVVFSIGPLRD